MLDEYVEGTDMNEIVGTCPQTLYRSSNLDSPFGNLAADALIWMAKKYHGVDADVSFYNTGGIRNPMLEGECRVKDIYFSFPFDNTLTTLTIKGSELKGVFSKIANSSSLFVNGNVRLVIARYRVESRTINGEPVYDEKEYKVATINYVSNLEKYGMSHLPAKESEGFITRYFVEYFRHLSAQNGGLIYYQSDGRVTYNE
jgi:2',3'-cyclic-nucleotide 2'-phosphodiesterase (5'-nucleotidase family)